MAFYISGSVDKDPRVSVAVGIVVGLLASIIQSLGRSTFKVTGSFAQFHFRSYHPEEESHPESGPSGRGEEGGL